LTLKLLLGFDKEQQNERNNNDCLVERSGKDKGNKNYLAKRKEKRKERKKERLKKNLMKRSYHQGESKRNTIKNTM
jgi:hypothetical protein